MKSGLCERCGWWRCQCPSVLDEIFSQAFERKVESLPLDCNLRFSANSPSAALLNILKGTLSHRRYVEIVQATSLFYAHKWRQGNAVIFETHSDSVSAGLDRYAEQKREARQSKRGFDGFIRMTKVSGG